MYRQCSIKYGKNGTVTCIQYIVPVHNMTKWEPTTGDVHKLMREPSNINDSNAVAI